MAPQKTIPEHDIDRTQEYQDFIAKLQAYHEKRGTNFDPEPKVGTTHVDLLKVYKYVIDNGGYDKITDEKLAWRKVCTGLGLHSNNEAAAAFALKTLYYKNLAAYEILTVYNKEPPPPEILEHQTARGGSLLTRTKDNFKPANRRETGQDSPQPSGDDGTPARDRRPEDTPGSGRAARGLREAPPQRVIFQPDTGSTRPSRQSAGQSSSNATPSSHSHTQGQPHSMATSLAHQQGHAPPAHTPQPLVSRGASAQWNPPAFEGFSSAVQSFEPRAPVPLPIRPVETPANNPAEFAKRQRIMRQQAAGSAHSRQPPVPGTAFEGPNIYVRCLCALRSEVPSEQSFALNHLVKISYERGDKYKYESFPGLAEGLVEKALQVGNLFYHVNWIISYDPDSDEAEIGELDGINGTADILERITQLIPRDVQDNVQPAKFVDEMVLVTEATLTIRNMVMLPENALALSEFAPLKDLLCIILHLPHNEINVELKHFALDIAEQLTPNLILESDDPLYQTLLSQLNSTDRGKILTALRAIGRISMNLAETNKLGEVPPGILENIMNWLLLNDDELLDACLDFLYQYTAVVSNMDTLLKSINPENMVAHLVRLLSHGAKRVHREQILVPETKIPASEEVVQLPTDLQEHLLGIEEPDRCYTWLKCLFDEDPESSITQIAIWSAYQQAFSARLLQMKRTMISPADFIRNVNHVWTHAGAQILRSQNAQGAETQKFIIKGIRARRRPVDIAQRDYFRCCWTAPEKAPPRCNQFFANAEKMYDHIMAAHLDEKRGEDNKYKNKEQEYRCLWSGCRKFIKPTKMRLSQFMQHIKTHLVAVQQKIDAGSNHLANGSNANKQTKRPFVVPAKTMTLTYEETPTTRDERNPNAPYMPAGIPLSAMLVLRNIARNVVKTEAEEDLLKQHEMGGEGGGWNERLFRPMLPRLYEIMTENKPLASYITSLFQLIRDD